MGGWAVAQSPILITTITLERQHKRGYVDISGINVNKIEATLLFLSNIITISL